MKNKFFIILTIFLVLPSFMSLAQKKDPIDEIEEYVNHWHNIGRFNGILLVAEKDKILYTKGFGYANREWRISNSPDTKFDIGSISKQFTTVMIFQLIDEGKIRLTDKLTDHLPEYRKDTGDRVTIDNLLQHTSGIPCYIREWTYTEDEEKNEIPGPLRHHFKSNYLISRYMCGDLQFEPGSEYHYSSSNHYLLGKIIERISGKSLEENLEERIFKPLGLVNTGLNNFEKIIPNISTGYINIPTEDAKPPYYYYPNLYGTGAIYSTVEDLFRWNRALETDRLLPQRYHDKLFIPYWNIGEEHSYLFNYFSSRISTGAREISYTSFSGAFDGFRTDVFRFPETGHIIVIYDNSEQENQWEMIPGIYRILINAPFEKPSRLASWQVSKIALTQGIEHALKEYDNMRNNKKNEYDFSMVDREINQYASRYIKLRRINCAERLLQLNTMLFPYSSSVWESYARILAREGKDELSKNANAKASEIQKLENDMIALITEKKYDEAEEKIMKVRKESPDRIIFTPSRIGPMYGKSFSSQMYDHALKICYLWRLGNPDAAGPYFSMANVYIKTGKNEEAASCYRTIIELFPGQNAEAARKELENLRKK